MTTLIGGPSSNSCHLAFSVCAMNWPFEVSWRSDDNVHTTLNAARMITVRRTSVNDNRLDARVLGELQGLLVNLRGQLTRGTNIDF